MNPAAERTVVNGRYLAAPDPLARFLKYVLVSRYTGCHNWTGALIGKSGYGLFWHNGKKVIAHRWRYEQDFGRVKRGLYVCHKCDNRRCVNLEHLFVGTPSDNQKDASRKGRLKLPNRWALYPNGRKPLGEEA